MEKVIQNAEIQLWYKLQYTQKSNPTNERTNGTSIPIIGCSQEFLCAFRVMGSLHLYAVRVIWYYSWVMIRVLFPGANTRLSKGKDGLFQGSYLPCLHNFIPPPVSDSQACCRRQDTMLIFADFWEFYQGGWMPGCMLGSPGSFNRFFPREIRIDSRKLNVDILGLNSYYLTTTTDVVRY